MAVLIVSNFLANIMQAENNPDPGSPEQNVFDSIDFAFTGGGAPAPPRNSDPRESVD